MHTSGHSLHYTVFHKIGTPSFLLHDAMQSAVMPQYVICPSVTFRYRDHTGWNKVLQK